eukprot:4401448-Prymnesium_polylepis.1
MASSSGTELTARLDIENATLQGGDANATTRSLPRRPCKTWLERRAMRRRPAGLATAATAAALTALSPACGKEG